MPAALSIVIVSYNRRDALRRTLSELQSQGLLDSAQVIVVDNGSADGSCAMVREQFPGVTIIALPDNRGVQAFNIGADKAAGDLLLILDDDAWPHPGALDGAVAMLGAAPKIGAIPLLPRHPASGVDEWRHDNAPHGAWPVMGCGNLVRRDDWARVGGYESEFFLYRNDTDLALKLLEAGRDVWFDPSWIVWHDSPGGGGGARKSERWLRLATRNWGWLARRHGRGLSKWLGMAAGFLWAARLAGPSLARQWCVLRGVASAFTQRPPALPAACRADGRAFAALVQRQLSR